MMILGTGLVSHAQETLQLKVDSIYQSERTKEEKIQAVSTLINAQDTAIHTAALGYAYHRLGLLYNRNKDYPAAITATQKAVQIREKVTGVSAKDLDNSLYNLFFYAKKMHRPATGKPYLERILERGADNKFYYRALNSLAMLKADKGDYFAALDDLEQLFNTIDQDAYTSEFLKASKDGIWIYSQLSDPGRYLSEIDRLERQLQAYKLEEEDLVNVNNNLGAVYSRLGDTPKAVTYYARVEVVHRRYQDSLGLSEVYNNLGIAHSQLGDFEQAADYYRRGLRYADPTIQAFIYDNQGFYLQQDDPAQQLRLFQQAIYTILDGADTAPTLEALPDFALIENSPQRLHLLTFLIDKATAWVDLYDLEFKSQHLVRAKETLYLLDRLVSSIRLESESEQSKLFWIDHGVDFYVLATRVCFLLEKPEEAFYFMEKNKSLLLLENLVKADGAGARLLATTSLADARAEHVSPNAVLVEYILNEERGFGLFCSQEGMHFFELQEVPILIEDIKRLKRMMETPFTGKAEFTAFDVLSHSIFQKLFPFGTALDQLTDRRLTVVPDYELHNLPFEALTTRLAPNTFAKHYLLNTTETSYLHSCSVEQRLSDRPATPLENGMIGFVPTVFANDTLADLRQSEQEMQQIASFFPSKLVLRDQATKASFIAALNQYGIIHINSHAGYTRRSTPWLAFYDQQIQLEELSTYQNRSNLVILDACKSARGEQRLGEGIMSLARAFFYGGSAGVIAAQWQVNEKSSGELFREFYHNLRAGQSKSEALHYAKRTYLAAHQLSQLSPYYWASFTLTGDAGPVVMEREYNWWRIVAAALLGLLLAGLLIRHFF